jgi:hypothetical protein
MYIGRNNQFYTEAEGGYINVRSRWMDSDQVTNFLLCSLPTNTTAVSAALTDLLATLPATKSGLEVGIIRRQERL